MQVKVRWCLKDCEAAKTQFIARFVVDAEGEPDYIIHGAGDDIILSYPDAIRICLSADGLVPDYNLSDYGISPDDISLGDRHFCAVVGATDLWLDFMAKIFACPKVDAFRRDRDYWGRFYESTRRLLADMPEQAQQARQQHEALSQAVIQIARIVESRKGTDAQA